MYNGKYAIRDGLATTEAPNSLSFLIAVNAIPKVLATDKYPFITTTLPAELTEVPIFI